MAATRSMPKPHTPAPTPPRLSPRPEGEALAAELETLMCGLIAAHERLLIAMEAHRLALTHADSAEIGAAVECETLALTEIADLERARAALMGTDGPRTITQLAQTLPDTARDRVLMLAEQLRELIHELRGRQAVVRAATRSLLSHTQGLMAQVGAALSHAGTYGRAGKVQSTTPACAALDLSS